MGNNNKFTLKEDRKSYEDSLKRVKGLIGSVQTIFSNKGITQEIKTRRFLKSGNIDPNKLASAMANQQNVYMRKSIEKNYTETTDYAFVIILDLSGSMSYIREFIQDYAILFYEAFHKNDNIELFIYGHNQSLYNFIDNKNTKRIHNRKYVLGSIHSLVGYDQYDGAAYYKILSDVKSKTSKKNIIALTITDSIYRWDKDDMALILAKICKKLGVLNINNLTIFENLYSNKSEFELIKSTNDYIYGEGNYVWHFLKGNKYNLTSKEIYSITKQIYNINKRLVSKNHKFKTVS